VTRQGAYDTGALLPHPPHRVVRAAGPRACAWAPSAPHGTEAPRVRVAVKFRKPSLNTPIEL